MIRRIEYELKLYIRWITINWQRYSTSRIQRKIPWDDTKEISSGYTKEKILNLIYNP